MSDSQATVNIPKDVLEPIVRQQVAAGIVAALGDPAQMIDKVVQFALSQKVMADGSVDRNHDYYNKYPFIETIAKNAIHKVTKEAIAEWVEEHKPLIRESVKKMIAKRQNAMVRALVDGMVDAVKQNWKFECNISLPRD